MSAVGKLLYRDELRRPAEPTAATMAASESRFGRNIRTEGLVPALATAGAGNPSSQP